MVQDQWTQVDRYITDLFVAQDEVLESTLAASREAGLPAIHVSPNEGKLLYLLARVQQARSILEIGTLGGYSTIWLARALIDDSSKEGSRQKAEESRRKNQKSSRLITLEADAQYAEIARANIARAGLADIVELRLGNALETLPKLVAEGRGPFDFVFIDADKESYPEYFQWALALSRAGTLIVADNVVRKGAVIDEKNSDASVQGVRRFNELVAACPQASATAIQTVGSKGYDGFAVVLVEKTNASSSH